MRKIALIISREFSERARKKSFIVTTLLMPLLMVGLMLAPALIAIYGGGSTKRVVVVDESGRIAERLTSTAELQFENRSDMSKAEACRTFNEDSDVFAILYVGSDIERDNAFQLITNSSSTPVIEQVIVAQLESIIEHDKLEERYNITNLDAMLADVNTTINLHTFVNNGTGDENSMETTSSGISYALSMVLGMLLYMIIVLYGQMVLTSVAEEKSSRVLDVMVTSCTPFQLMMGKILGIATVALTQVAIWSVLVIGASKFLVPIFFSEEVVASNDMIMSGLLGTLGDTGYMASLLVYLVLFLLGGLLLYSSVYAAAGSAVDSVQDGQQFNNIILLPIVLAIIVMMSVFNDPNSSLAMWFSFIPFTSPVVMIARIPFGIPMWEIMVSLLILYLSFIITTWLASKIYRIGIFTHGKAASWRDLWQWIRVR
jgi:ABC-2 type transport system permease protein